MKFPFEVLFTGMATPTRKVKKVFKAKVINSHAALEVARKRVERSPKLRDVLYPVYRVTCMED